MSNNNEALAEQLATKHYKAMCAKELGHLSTIDTIASAIREALAQAQPPHRPALQGLGAQNHNASALRG